MKSKRLGVLLFAAVVGIATVLVLVGLADVSSALAQTRTGNFSAQRKHLSPPAPFDITIYFTDPNDIYIADLTGNILGVGIHRGEVRCNRISSCNQKTQLYFTIPATINTTFEYKFTTLEGDDPDERRVVVSGWGTLSKDGRKERFLFTATFQDNRDGTIMAIYDASRPDASFIIPNSPGWMRIKLP